MREHKRTYRVMSLLLLAALAALFLFPLYWIVTGAFKPAGDIYSAEPVWWPTRWTLDNFRALFSGRTAPVFELFGVQGPQGPAVLRWLLNTLFMALASVALTCVTASMAGYALAKKRFRGRALIFGLVVCAMALPKQVVLIPLLKEMAGLRLYNTLWAVILPMAGWPFGVFLMRQFSRRIPDEMLEAARMDGAGELRIFRTIALPLLRPGIGALAVFTFVSVWNDYFMQLVMLSDSDVHTISLGVATLMDESSTDMGMLMAGAALSALPIILVFLMFQKNFTQSITAGAVKG